MKGMKGRTSDTDSCISFQMGNQTEQEIPSSPQDDPSGSLRIQSSVKIKISLRKQVKICQSMLQEHEFHEK